MRLAVSADDCMGHGRCYTVAPELLTYDDEGYVTVRGSSIEVPPDQYEAAREATGSCPEAAISLIESE